MVNLLTSFDFIKKAPGDTNLLARQQKRHHEWVRFREKGHPPICLTKGLIFFSTKQFQNKKTEMWILYLVAISVIVIILIVGIVGLYRTKVNLLHPDSVGDTINGLSRFDEIKREKAPTGSLELSSIKNGMDHVHNLEEENQRLQVTIRTLQDRLKSTIQNDITSSSSVMNVNIRFPLPDDLVVKCREQIKLVTHYVESSVDSSELDKEMDYVFELIKLLESKAIDKLETIFQSIQSVISNKQEPLDHSIKGSVIHKLRKDFAETHTWSDSERIVHSLLNTNSTQKKELSQLIESCGHIIWAMLLCDPQMIMDWSLSFNEMLFVKHKTLKQGDSIPNGHLIYPPIVSSNGHVWAKGDIL